VVVGRAPFATNGEISSAPAGGWEVSVAVVDPAGSSLDSPAAIVPNVTTIRPLVRYAADEVMVGRVCCRNESAVLIAPGVPAAHAVPAAPSGQGGWRMLWTLCGSVVEISAASVANAVADSPDHVCRNEPEGIAWLSM